MWNFVEIWMSRDIVGTIGMLKFMCFRKSWWASVESYVVVYIKAIDVQISLGTVYEQFHMYIFISSSI